MRNLSNYEIVKIAEGMPGGLQGFCKTWGWVQFGRALLTAAAATPQDQDRPDAIAKWGTPPAAESGIKWQCGPQASGFTAPQTDSQPVPVPRWDEMIRQQFPDMPPKGWSDTLIRRYMTRELDAYRAARAALVSQQPAPSVAAHKACKPDMLVNAGALKLALNVLRRAGKHEVADELEKTAQAAPAYKDSTPELHVGDSAFESWYSTYNPAHKSDKQRDQLVSKLAGYLGLDFGEHSSANDPWQNAMDALDEKPTSQLAVWFGSMPESNGKVNWTAILYRKETNTFLSDLGDGYTLARSEYTDRVRYEADRVRFLIGELATPPWILDYDSELKAPADYKVKT